LAKAVPVLEAESAVLGQGLKKSSMLKYGQETPLRGSAEEIIHDRYSAEHRRNQRPHRCRKGKPPRAVEQAAAYSGAADEDLISQRIAEHEALLERLIKQRDELSQKAGT